MSYTANLVDTAGTLVANVETVVPVVTGFPVVVIAHLGSGGPPIFVRTDGTAAAVGTSTPVVVGDVVELKVDPASGRRPQISLISAAAQPYLIQYRTRFRSTISPTRIPDLSATYLNTTQKGAAGGVAPLDLGSLIPVSNLPDLSTQYLTVARRASANGVASLDSGGRVPVGQVPDLSALYVNVSRTALNLRDYGAVGDGVADDTAAVLAWLAAIYDDGRQIGNHRSGYAPRGIYLITAHAVFNTFTNNNEYAPVLFGDGHRSSVFKLQTGGTEKWFYQNVDNRLNGAIFRDLGFITDSMTFGNGFDIVGFGFETGFVFETCRFATMATAVKISNTAGADSMLFIRCQYQQISQKVFHLTNNQSVQNWFISCMVTTGSTAHLVYVDGNGGGNTYWVGGTVNVDTPLDGLPRYLLYVNTSGTNLGPQNGDYYFNGLKVEFRDDLARIMTQQRLQDGVLTTFNQCNLTKVDGSDRISVDVLTARVMFRDCALSNKHLYTVGQTSSSVTVASTGALEFHGCGIQGEDPSTLFTVRNQGRVTMRRTNCLSSRTVRASEDMDLNWHNSGYGDSGASVKTAVLKPNYGSWPESDVAGGRESTIRLPYGAYLQRIVVRKEASSGGAATYQLHVGNDDKSVTYGSSVSAAQSAVHTVVVENLDKYVSSTIDRVVRLWSTDGGNPNNVVNQGIGYVEYI